jgi:hypothetical protein
MASYARDDVNLDNGRDSGPADRTFIRDPLDSG